MPNDIVIPLHCHLTFAWRFIRAPLPACASLQVNFRTAFYDESASLVTSNRAIAVGYLTSWFLIDFISCLPINYLQLVLSSGDNAGGGNSANSSVKTVRILRSGKLLRIGRLGRILRRAEDTPFEDILQTFKSFGLIAMLLWVTHIL